MNINFDEISKVLASLVKEFGIELLATQLVHGKSLKSSEKGQAVETVKTAVEGATKTEGGAKALQPLVDLFSLGDEACILLHLAGLRAAKSKSDNAFAATIDQIDAMAGWLENVDLETRKKLRAVVRAYQAPDARIVLDQLATMSTSSRKSYIVGAGILDPNPLAQAGKKFGDWAEKPADPELMTRVKQKRERNAKKWKFWSLEYWGRILARPVKTPAPEQVGGEAEERFALRTELVFLEAEWQLRWWWARLQLALYSFVVLFAIHALFSIMIAGPRTIERDFYIGSALCFAMFTCIGIASAITGAATAFADIVGEQAVNLLNSLPGIEGLINPLDLKEAKRKLIYSMSIIGLLPTFVTDSGTYGGGALQVIGGGIVVAGLIDAIKTPGKWRRRLELGALYYHCLRIPYWIIAYALFEGDRTWGGWWTRHWQRLASAWDTFSSFPGQLILATLIIIGLAIYWARLKQWAAFGKLCGAVVVLLLLFPFWGKWVGVTPDQTYTQSSNSKQVVAENWCTSPALSIAANGEFDFTATCPSPAAGGIVPAGKKITITKVSGVIKPKPDWDQVPGLEGKNHNADASAAQWRAQLRYPDSNVWAVLAITSNGQVVPFVGDKAEITNPTGGDLKWSLYYNDEFRNPLAWQGHSGTIRFRVETK